MVAPNLTSLFEKKTYLVEILGFKWDLDTKKFEQRIIRHIKRGTKGVTDWSYVDANPKEWVQSVVRSDISVLVRWLHRLLKRKGYLQVNYPETSYEPAWVWKDRIWGVEGQYRFKIFGIKRDEYIDKRFDKNTTLHLPDGKMIFELAILKEEPKAFWTSEDIPK